MPDEESTSSPKEAYKAIIDQLVGGTSFGVTEKLVREQGIFSKAPSERHFNGLVQSLSGEQQRMLAEMLHLERTAAIHDVLAVLSWWAGAGGVGFTFRGQAMPVDLSGMGLHGDYVGRQEGWAWPKDDESQ